MTPASDAADAGSQKRPSSDATSLYAESISSSVTASMTPPDSSLAATAVFQLAGFPILIADAIVLGFSTGRPRTKGAAPSAWKPNMIGSRLTLPALKYSL